MFLIQEEKERANAALIRQSQENERLQTPMNHELDTKVREKTAELIQLYVAIEKDKEQKTQNELTQKTKETDMVAFRSQMNPHLLFNNMTSLKNQIMTARDEDTMAYLDNFRILLRPIH